MATNQEPTTVMHAQTEKGVNKKVCKYFAICHTMQSS